VGSASSNVAATGAASSSPDNSRRAAASVRSSASGDSGRGRRGARRAGVRNGQAVRNVRRARNAASVRKLRNSSNRKRKLRMARRPSSRARAGAAAAEGVPERAANVPRVSRNCSSSRTAPPRGNALRVRLAPNALPVPNARLVRNARLVPSNPPVKGKHLPPRAPRGEPPANAAVSADAAAVVEAVAKAAVPRRAASSFAKASLATLDASACQLLVTPSASGAGAFVTGRFARRCLAAHSAKPSQRMQ